MSFESERVTYEVVVSPTAPRPLAGVAFQNHNDGFYQLVINMFPSCRYYIRKDTEVHDRFTIYSRKIVDQLGKDRLVNPIGHGILNEDDKSYLTLYFPILNLTLYMNLYPKKRGAQYAQSA